MKITHILHSIEEAMTAATFAEANEHRTALEILRQGEKEKTLSRANQSGQGRRMGSLQPAA